MPTVTEVDVAICGAGLAGLTLARQLRREVPGVSVVVLDRLERPLPEAAFKVGESSTEIGSFYLASVLGLGEYLERSHLPKLGFRFFFGSRDGSFASRPELGLVDFPTPTSYNYDRGILENDLRALVEAEGVALLEGCHVRDVELAGDGGLHRVFYADSEEAEPQELRARWVVDALGRRRLIQSKLGLNTARNRRTACNAAWFRFEGRLDVEDLVPASQEDWHRRVPAGRRYFSTNHLVGAGYWVWLIPLPSNHTSVGIVASDDRYPYAEFNRWDRARDWLRRYEPQLAAHIGDREPEDFGFIRRYSRTTRRIFSGDRWACIGDAAVFADPLYAAGLDVIGFENSAVSEMIRLDREGRLDPQQVAYFNRSILGINQGLTMNIQLGYQSFENPVVGMSKVAWDTAVAWGLFAPRMFNRLFLDREATARVFAPSSRAFFLIARMQSLFVQWREKSTRALDFDFVSFLELPNLKPMRRRNLRPGKTLEELREDQVTNLEALEELALILFLIAVEDTLPEQLGRLLEKPWLDPWAVSLSPESWEADGLLRPEAPGRPEALRRGYRAMRGLLRPPA